VLREKFIFYFRLFIIVAHMMFDFSLWNNTYRAIANSSITQGKRWRRVALSRRSGQ
jgi:hypothetical protein